MKERFKASQVMRPLLALTLAGGAITTACGSERRSPLNEHIQIASAESTSIPTKVLVQVARLNEESPNSNFTPVRSDSGDLLLMSEQGNGLYPEGQYVQDEQGNWDFIGTSVQGEIIQAPIEAVSADEDAQGLLHVKTPGTGVPDEVIVPEPLLPNLP